MTGDGQGGSNTLILLPTIELVYQAAGDPRFWASFLRLAAETLNAREAVLLDGDPDERGPLSVAVGAEPSRIRWPARTPRSVAGSRTLCLSLGRGRSRVQLYFSRGPRDAPFEASDLRTLRTLAPHVRRALQIHQGLLRLESERAATVGTLDSLPSAVFLVDASSRIVVANRRAQAMVAAPDGLSLDRDRLCGSTASDTRRLREMCRTAAAAREGDQGPSSGVLVLDRRPSGRLSLQVLVTSVASNSAGLADRRVAALVVVTDPSERPPVNATALRQLFGLTPAECDVARRLADGQSLAEIAAHRGSAVETVRRQNRHILAKTGTRRRSDLVKLIVATVVPL